MHIRPERPTDIPGIRAVNLAAFETSTEADLVDALREQVEPIVSLVADDGEAIVGHILFSPVTLMAHPELRIIGLRRWRSYLQDNAKGSALPWFTRVSNDADD
jgi:putative acetyltransferase